MNARPRILLVDDDESQLLVARRAIARLEVPADVETASTGEEALQRLGLAPGSPAPGGPTAVVLLDLNLPDMTGIEVLMKIRASARYRSLPVVLVSTSARPDDVRRAYESGANSYLVKPLDHGQPGRDLAEAARYWVQLNLSPEHGPERAHSGL